MPIDRCGLEAYRCDLMTTICSAGRGGTHDFSVDNLKAVLEEVVNGLGRFRRTFQQIHQMRKLVSIYSHSPDVFAA